MSSSSTTLPADWLMLDRFVFCSENFAFPKDADSTLVSGTNSMDRKFRICFKLVKPSKVSRLYLEIDGGLCEFQSFDIVAAHRGALILQMSYPIYVPDCKPVTMIDYFLYRTAGGGSLPSMQRLPDVEGTVAQIQDRIKANAYVITHHFIRRLACLDLGVLCRGEDEVAIADLEITGSGEPPKLHIMFPSISSSWKVNNPPIIPHNNNVMQFDLEEFLRKFDADTVVPFEGYLFWVDYSLGILFCNVFDESPKLQYLELPAQWPEFCCGGMERTWAEGSHVIGVTKGGIMKFVKVFSGAHEFPQITAPASDGFTIISWELKRTESNSMKWEQDTVLRTSEIKFGEHSDIPRAPFGYPVISMDEPSVIYFMIGDNHKAITHNKIWIVAIDIASGMVVSTSKYINGVEQVEDLYGEEAFYFATEKPRDFTTFLPAEFSKHLNLLGTR